MNNYLKFATYQLIGFTSSIPRLIKIKKNPDKFTNLGKSFSEFFL
ncbi:hypothetical protein ACTPD5_21465 [Clostridioides difficile]